VQVQVQVQVQMILEVPRSIRAPVAWEVKVTVAAILCLCLGKLAPAMVMMRGAICPH
jgi:hypothetical protein